MIQEKTGQKIENAHYKLCSVNDQLNDYLVQLTGEEISRTSHDREIVRQIRDKNLQTIQFIDKLEYIRELL